MLLAKLNDCLKCTRTKERERRIKKKKKHISVNRLSENKVVYCKELILHRVITGPCHHGRAAGDLKEKVELSQRLMSRCSRTEVLYGDMESPLNRCNVSLSSAEKFSL